MEMYRLLLLDDEQIVINGIQKVFDLNAMGFELAGTFNNPEKALEQAPALKPDLIITDVKMPGMDGLEFATRIKQILPDTEIVILSGYDDFSYAQAAVRIGVRDYLLKPIKKDDFRNMMEKMHRRIDEKTSERDYLKSLQEVVQNSYTELKNRFFFSLAENGVYDEKLHETLKRQWDRDYADAVFMLIKADIYRLSTAGDYMSEVGKLTQSVEEVLSAYGKVEDFLSDESLYFLLYDIRREDEQKVRDALQTAVEEKQQNGMQLSVGISAIHQGFSEMFDARNDCFRQIFMSEAQIDEASDANPVRRQEDNVNIPYTDIETLFQAISVGNEQGLLESVAKMYEIPENGVRTLQRDYSLSVTFLILLRIYQLQNKYGAEHRIVDQRLLDIKNIRREYPGVHSQKELVEEKALELSALIAGQEVSVTSRMIRAALDYIGSHFSENISLQDVADEISISRNYLCDIFKKELGVTFINYVTNLRIEKAKEYLANTDMKMYEVSDAVGYSDYAYFSQLFKKHTGTTLSSYRKNL